MTHTKDKIEIAAQSTAKKILETRKQEIIDSQDATAWINLAYCFYYPHHWHKEAIECLERGLELNPHHVGAWSQLGKVFYDLHQLEKAVEYLERAVDLDSNYGEVWGLLGQIFYDKQEFEKAIGYCNIAISIDTQDVLIWGVRGDAYYAIKDYKNAAISYRLGDE